MKHALMTALGLVAIVSGAYAQDAPATPGVLVPAPVIAVPPIAVAPARPAVPPRNVRFEILITDGGIPKPTTKKVSMTVATGRAGQLRSVASEARGESGSTRSVPLNVDVNNPMVLDNGSIMASIVIEYQPTSPGTLATPATVKASLTTILASGRKMLISETADPTSDRTTTLEVTATLLP